jgi:hypothetical protein
MFHAEQFGLWLADFACQADLSEVPYRVAFAIAENLDGLCIAAAYCHLLLYMALCSGSECHLLW